MPDLPAVNYKGKLRKISDKTILLDLDDGRTATFQRSGKTKFYKDSKEIKASALNIGDRVSVDAAEDPQAFLDALKVTFDNSPPVAEAHGAGPPGSVESPSQTIQYDDKGRPTLRKRIPGPEQTEPREASGDAASSDQPPSTDDSGRPTLKRRNPAEPENAGTQQAAEAVPPASPVPSSSGRIEPSRPQDPLIDKARAAADASSTRLPNFICQEVMSRSTRDSNGSGWQPIDVVSTEVVYEDGKESRRNLKINDRPAEKEEMSGAWPIGKLVTTLSDVFSPATRAQFRFGGDTNLLTLQARVYDFDVAAENSRWTMRMGSQDINAAYGGSVWIDKESGRVLRLEMQARDLPEGFPIEKVETDVEYSFIRIGEEPALLPVHVETTGCQRGGQTCSRSVSDFQSFRKYTTDSNKP